MMPAAFIGHGSPMNAITETEFSRAWRTLGARLPKPQAILCISAHWYIEGLAVTAMPAPRTIHDFYGFPKALHDVEYPAPGDPALAQEIVALLSPMAVESDMSWGLDHGTWSILVHMQPNADVPVLQLSIDETKPPREHYELGRRLRPLREAGVLIVGSGNIVHNLRMMGDIHANYEWAARFDTYIRNALQTNDINALTQYAQHPDARFAVPTPEHYLPLLYIAGLRTQADKLEFIVDGNDLASISMTALTVG